MCRGCAKYAYRYVFRLADFIGGLGHGETRNILWFGDDFVGWEGQQEMSFTQELSVRDAAILRTIARYLSREEREFLREGSFRVAFTEYDWALNAL